MACFYSFMFIVYQLSDGEFVIVQQ